MTFLGIDCGQLRHRFCLIDGEGQVLAEGAFSENRRGLAELSARVEEHQLPQAVVMEASGACWQNLCAELQGWGWPAQAVDPQRAAQFARLHNPRHKTDKADARSLARLGLEAPQASFSGGAQTTLAHGLARGIQQRSALLNQLHCLVVVANPALLVCRWRLGARRSLAVLRAYPTTRELRRARALAQVRFGRRGRLGEKAAETLREAAQQVLWGALNEAHATQVRFLVGQIAAWDAEISRLQAELRTRLPQAQRLTSIMGVGERTALLVYACVPFAQLASAKQAAAYVGLHPHVFQSGASQWSRLSKRGDRIARTALYRAALPAVQSNSRLRAFYQRLLSAGKAKKQALCAVAHKLIRICFALVRYQTTYSLNYQPLKA